MHDAVCSEIIKFRRNRMAWLGTLIIITIPLFMIWNRLVIDTQREYMEWLMSVLMLNTLILPIVNGFVITSSMQREYQDRTIRNVLTAPVSREKFLTAKLIVWFLWYLISFCLSEAIAIAGCYALYPVEFTTGNMRYALSLFTQNNFFYCGDSYSFDMCETAGTILSFHACHIGKRSIAGGGTASIRRTNTPSLCMSLDGSIYFRHSWI